MPLHWRSQQVIIRGVGCVGNSRRCEKSTVNRDGSCFADRSVLYLTSSHLVFSIGWIFSPPTSWATSFGSAWRMTKIVIFICCGSRTLVNIKTSSFLPASSRSTVGTCTCLYSANDVAQKSVGCRSLLVKFRPMTNSLVLPLNVVAQNIIGHW